MNAPAGYCDQWPGHMHRTRYCDRHAWQLVPGEGNVMKVCVECAETWEWSSVRTTPLSACWIKVQDGLGPLTDKEREAIDKAAKEQKNG